MALSSTTHDRRQQLLAELGNLTSIERGSLYEEYREVPDPNGSGSIRLGPYYKHQCWEGGRNRSARVPAQQATALRQDLAQGLQFDAVTRELATLALAESRQRRALNPPAEFDLTAKKNSTPRAKAPSGKKPKRASMPSAPP